MRILAVDDDPVFLELLVGMFETLGYGDVTTVNSAHEAVVSLGQAAPPFDCLMFDIQMPGMDGVQLCRIVRSLPVYRRTPIVMITAASGKAFVDDAFAAGATDYIGKPLDRQEFTARIGMVMRLHEERQRMAALQRQAGSPLIAADFHIDFEAPLVLPGVDRAFDYLVLENYLLTLGIKRLFAIAAFGIQIANARVIFSKAGPAGFVDMLGDVASVIFDSLKTEEVMLSYAGGGNFVGLVNRDFAVDLDELDATIRDGLADFQGFYGVDQMPMPRVTVGKLVRSSIFTSNRSTRILDQAIEMAASKTGRKVKQDGVAA